MSSPLGHDFSARVVVDADLGRLPLMLIEVHAARREYGLAVKCRTFECAIYDGVDHGSSTLRLIDAAVQQVEATPPIRGLGIAEVYAGTTQAQWVVTILSSQ